MTSQHRLCVDCGADHYGKVDKCRKCQCKESMKKLYQDPEARARKLEKQRIRRQDPEVRRKQREAERRYSMKRKIANVNAIVGSRKLQVVTNSMIELRTPNAIEQKPLVEDFKERERRWKREYEQRKRDQLRNGPDERPPGTKRDGFWRCPGCGGKMLGSVKRCLACVVTERVGVVA